MYNLNFLLGQKGREGFYSFGLIYMLNFVQCNAKVPL